MTRARLACVRLAAAAAGLVIGAGVVLAVQQSSGPDRWPPPEPARTAARPGGAAPATAPPPSEQVLLVWTSGGLPPGLGDRVGGLAGVERATTVRGGLVELEASWDIDGQPVDRPPEGFAVALDAIAYDPVGYPAFVPAPARRVFAGLQPGHALLSATSARLRRLGPGATLQLAGGRRLTVADVVDDTLVGAAEVVVASHTADVLGLVVERYLLATYRSERAAAEAAVRALLPADTPVRLRGPGETPFLRHGDAVLPQALVKERFGEFAHRPGPGRTIVQDAGWVGGHLVTADVPILGRVRCHRELLPALAGALDELTRRNLDGLLDPDEFAGCWAPRMTGSLDSVSRHAWGIAVDINVGDNPAGQPSAQDPRLVEVLKRWGFGWGGEWLVPDPAHFEYLRPPTPGG